MNSVRFFLYSLFHGKDKPVGSDFIRAIQVIDNWDEAKLYKYGENTEVLIFMKVFMSPDYQFPKHFKGIKILDMCDPMWLEDYEVVATCNEMDAVTVPTKALARFVGQFHDNVHIIPDRFDLSVIPEPKLHKEKAKTVVWFGYSHNAETLKPAMHIIDELGLNLIIISNDDPIMNRYSNRPREEWYTFIKHEENIYEHLLKADFAIFPDGFRPQDEFKSNNKTIKANLVGLPVAKDADQVRLYMYPEARQAWFDNNYEKIRDKYDIKKSIAQYKEIIKKLMV